MERVRTTCFGAWIARNQGQYNLTTVHIHGQYKLTSRSRFSWNAGWSAAVSAVRVRGITMFCPRQKSTLVPKMSSFPPPKSQHCCHRRRCC
eukprot:3642516-Rhodomonas_salina.1